MISAEAAIFMGRTYLGTSYEELDCINFIKKVIRTAPGGDKNYTTAGTNDLWNSDSKSAKYRDLTWKQEGISGAKAGMLAFMGVGTGDVDHVGLVTERGTVLHSSKSRGEAVETELTEKRGWNGLGKHRLIAVDDGEKEDENTMSDHAFGNATVNVTSGYLNLREGASTRGKVIGTLEIGQRVNVIREAGSGWVFSQDGKRRGRIRGEGVSAGGCAKRRRPRRKGDAWRKRRGRDGRRLGRRRGAFCHDDAEKRKRPVRDSDGQMDDCGGLNP